MKLGIIVVYLVGQRNEKLLDLHLNRIVKHTQVPYTIYGSANRLLPDFRRKLEQHPKVTICEVKTYEDSDARPCVHEHSFYLEQLIKTAIEDGSSHVAVLHVDSFPVSSGWAAEMAGKLSGTCVLAGIMRDEKIDRTPMSAFLFFHRDFYLKYRPTLLLSDEELSSSAYKQYLLESPHAADSGVGYGFKIHQEGLSWYPLLRSNKDRGYYLFGSIYNNLIFHLNSAAHVEFTNSTGFSDRYFDRRNIITIRKFAKAFLPKMIKEKLKSSVRENIFFSERVNAIKAFEKERKKLLENSDSYLTYLRTGKT